MVQNDITFNNVKQTIDFGMGPVGIAGQTGVDPEWGGVINAVDIDWNDANLGSYIISTTGQLLSYMSAISQKITNLENILINL